ncbi:linker for activation of T-cells family member 2 isoform X2 [Lepisosteus oculatus]|uniref:linker for activation of T-cells family member 2 isoform X2 n=1 Tax=Lepisosteus oculatus TaxID=7918 RepID=UPI00371BDE0A
MGFSFSWKSRLEDLGPRRAGHSLKIFIDSVGLPSIHYQAAESPCKRLLEDCWGKLMASCSNTKGMSAEFNPHGALLALLSAAPLLVILLMCLRCHRRSMKIREENQIYDPQLFEDRGFTVIRSKTVTRPNQIVRAPPPLPPEESQLEIEQDAQVVNGEHSKYQNVPILAKEGCEPMYVDPIAGSPYQNCILKTSEKDADSNSYENVFPTTEKTTSQDSDGSDYENSTFLQTVKRRGCSAAPSADEEGDEPDYVNALVVKP